MKEYIVKVLMDFNDYGGKEISPDVKPIQRIKGEIYSCNRERYLYLKSKKAVTLVGIVEQSK